MKGESQSDCDESSCAELYSGAYAVRQNATGNANCRRRSFHLRGGLRSSARKWAVR